MPSQYGTNYTTLAERCQCFVFFAVPVSEAAETRDYQITYKEFKAARCPECPGSPLHKFLG